MRIFVAGGTGVVGSRLIPLMVDRGHEVTATTTSDSKAAGLKRVGADPSVLDLLDREAVMRAVTGASPDVIVHQATALSAMGDNMRKFDKYFAQTNRLRTEGTRHLLEAGTACGTRRFVSQSFGGWPYARTGEWIKSEEDPVDPAPPKAFRNTLAALIEMEAAVLGADMEGLALRYGFFYGPGTSLGEGGVNVNAVRKRRLPIIGSGAGVWSFVHIDDAATAAMAACEQGAPGIYNICDDEPAPVAEWLPALANALGAKPPRRVPAGLARVLAGGAAVSMMTENRGASNAKARAVLDWELRWPTWRTGFEKGLPTAPTRAQERAGAGR